MGDQRQARGPGKRPKPAQEQHKIEPLLSVDEVAEVLRKPPDAVRKMMQRGRIPAVRLGKEFRVRRSEFQAFLDALPRAAPSYVDDESLWTGMLDHQVNRLIKDQGAP
jgi:excisionase family DNA binding protein